MKKRPAQSKSELARLRAWCLEVVDGIAELDPAAGADSVVPLRIAIDRAADLGDRKGLEQVVLDLREWVSGLTPKQRSSVEARLRARLGVGISDALPRSDVVLDQVVSRGFIETEDEFRAVEARVVVGPAEPGREEDLRKWNALLEDYVRRRHRLS